MAKPRLKIIPLGGLSEIGKNMMVMEYEDDIIAIDAGHGGEDSGARGRYGTKEKDVVLAISKQLAALINQEKGMRAVLIRKGDYYLPLRKRTQLARDHKADLFLSIHVKLNFSIKIILIKGITPEKTHYMRKIMHMGFRFVTLKTCFYYRREQYLTIKA